jgi:hypothetical protein
MFDLKKIHKDAVAQALERAHFYRLLNEPGAAESICLDVLEIDPDNQDALVALILAITDRFTKGYAVGATQAKELLPRLRTNISAPITPGSSASGRPKPGYSMAGLDRATTPTNGCATRWNGTRRRRRYAPPATTTRS